MSETSERSRRFPRLCAAAALIVWTLSGCTGVGNTIADLPGIGEPSTTPKRATQPPEYPQVFDRPPPRDDKTLTPAEREKLQAELKATRDRQEKMRQTQQAQ